MSMKEKFLKKITYFASDNHKKNSLEKYKKLLQKTQKSIT